MSLIGFARRTLTTTAVILGSHALNQLFENWCVSEETPVVPDKPPTSPKPLSNPYSFFANTTEQPKPPRQQEVNENKLMLPGIHV